MANFSFISTKISTVNFIHQKSKRFLNLIRNYCVKVKNTPVILGIETSCDDTGCAIVDANGKILGESLHSQQVLHLNNGGIIPPLAQEEHRRHIKGTVDLALERSNLSLEDVDGIAVTNRPGLPLSLLVGVRYARHLARKYNKPIIPIHHMEAHALTIRMGQIEKIPFPFLVLLISGGHSLLGVMQDIDKVILLGETLDDAPGEAFDKIARRLKLTNIPEYRGISGGRAIELAARKSKNPFRHTFPFPLPRYKDCQFSFSGLKNTAERAIKHEEFKYDVEADGVIPNFEDLCAGFQWAITRHLCHRTQRAMEYCTFKALLGNHKTLVVSGGAACNDFIHSALSIVCREKGYKIERPISKLCTDNGIMIAWNGIEKYLKGIDIITDIDSVDIASRSPFGDRYIEDVSAQNIKCKWIKLTELYKC